MAPSGNGPGRLGHAQAGALGAGPGRADRRERAVGGRRAVRLRLGPRPARDRVAGRQRAGVDVPAGDRATADVASLPARHPRVRLPRRDPGPAAARPSRHVVVKRYWPLAVGAVLALELLVIAADV